MKPKLLACLACLVALAAPSAALASPDYPDEMHRAAKMPCPPPCTLCHADSNGGIGTVIKPFGLAMIGAGLKAKDKSSIEPAVLSLFQDGVDSDSDGTSDILELDQGRDPNVAGSDSVCGPEYGCSVVEPSSAVGSSAAAALAGLMLSFVLRRRRRRRASARSQPRGSARRR